MKKFTFLVVLFAAISVYAQQPSFMTYYQMSPFMQASSGAFKYGLYGFDNPALTSYINSGDFMFAMQDKEINGYNPWGVFTGGPYGGFSMIGSGDKDHSIIDYRYSVAFGTTKTAFGVSYGFVGGDKSHFKRSNTVSAGTLLRPVEYLSVGGFVTYSIDKEDYEGVVDVAIRPFGDRYPLALFADASLMNEQKIDDALWSAGVSWEVVDGVRLNGRYFSNESASVGVDISFGMYGVGVNSMLNSSQEYQSSVISYRAGAIDRTIFGSGFSLPQKFFYELDLSGAISYQRGFFASNTRTLWSVITKIQELTENKQIDGLVINFTNSAVSREMLWEIRKELENFKKAGKEIVMFIDRTGMDGMHFASVANKIVIDPLGMVSLEGYILGRSFYKNMLDKAHIGYEEIRLFKYKSAAESFARDKMSDADREQRQALVDDWYQIAKDDITRSRSITPSEFDNLVNTSFIHNTKKLMDIKLVDAEGRWNNKDSVLNKLYPKIKMMPAIPTFKQPEPFDNQWAYQPKQIAIIYALGECSMDGGINARKLVDDIKFAMTNKNIAAVVLRVDSPGGDAMASDYIAEVMREFKGKKPIIVSQGAVAASGGYWLSMYADTIVAAPMTITGSIGVIASWIYDKGLKDTLGIHTDMVKVGKFADLGYPFQLPIIGLGLPLRNLTTEERGLFESYIQDSYDMFVSKVADGRNMPKDKVKEVAQGRVWSGIDGKANGLVDVLGGLNDAVKIALEKAGIDKDDNYEIIELPKPQFKFDLSLLSMLGIKSESIAKYFAITPYKDVNQAMLESLKFRLENNGKLLHIIPAEYYDSVVFE